MNDEPLMILQKIHEALAAILKGTAGIFMFQKCLGCFPPVLMSGAAVVAELESWYSRQVMLTLDGAGWMPCDGWLAG